MKAKIVTQAVHSLLIGAGALVALSAIPAPLASAASTQPTRDSGRSLERVAAVVNDDAITVMDLEARVRLALLSTNQPENQENIQRMAPQVLRSLIDEKLQLQEAKKFNVSISEADLDAAVGKIAEQNKMPRAALEKLMSSHNVPISTLASQVRANLAWTKLVQRKLRPTVIVGSEEIDAFIERMKANAGKPEYLTAEIFLSVDTPQRDDEVRRTAERLIEQIRKGTPFSAMARQFSQAAGANSGGDLGWVQPGQLPEELDRALMQMRQGTLSPPIRSASGYHILLVREQRTISAGDPRDARVHLKQAAFALKGSDRQSRVKRIMELSRSISGCGDFEAATRAAGAEKVSDLGTLRAGDLAAELGRMVATIPLGQVSPPFGSGDKAAVIVVCDRQIPPGGAPDRDTVYNQLGGERLEMLQRRYLIDLKRAANVEVRM
ncbi:MAG: peptidylprolyl isomerase [Rhodospirillaceae bacterium]